MRKDPIGKQLRRVREREAARPGFDVSAILEAPWKQKRSAQVAMRNAETIENDLMEISAIADDSIKLERIVAWCAAHPEEVPFALHQLLSRGNVEPSQGS